MLLPLASVVDVILKAAVFVAGILCGAFTLPITKSTPTSVELGFVITPKPAPNEPLIELIPKVARLSAAFGCKNIELETKPSAGGGCAMVVADNFVPLVIENPPISPEVAVTAPANVASPSASN